MRSISKNLLLTGLNIINEKKGAKKVWRFKGISLMNIFFQEYLQFRDDRRNLQELILNNCDKIVFPPQVLFNITVLQFNALAKIWLDFCYSTFIHHCPCLY